MDSALNNLQRLICHKTQQTKQTQLALPIRKLGKQSNYIDRYTMNIMYIINDNTLICIWTFLIIGIGKLLYSLIK